MLSDRRPPRPLFVWRSFEIVPDQVAVFPSLSDRIQNLTPRMGFLYVAGNGGRRTFCRRRAWRLAGVADKALPEFDEGNFDAEVLGRAGLTVVDFWADWCVPCKQLARLLGELVDELPEGVLVGKVDADANRDLVERYGVRAIPSLLFFKNGVLVEARTGVDRRQVLKKAIEAHA
jgi:thioredoxin